ncbi:MAG: ABC transporter ATP-binding protein, partial [Treponema sp.]|nr:ABC transporter ATP-binding protein [Treponema sp.]
MVRAISFCKSYSSKKNPACKDINFEAERGKITVLLGPNGAGKSTLLKALCAMHYASSGQVLLERNDGAIFDAAEQSQEVKAITGFIGEVPALYDDWTVSEFLRAAAALRLAETDCKAKTAAALKAARLCNLDGVLKQKISSLSHGYKQRVNFAQALVHDPQILILDEPATGLDPQQIREMRELVQSLKKGRAVVFSTHIIQEAEALADKIYIIKDSAVVASGSPKELLKQSGKSNLEDAYLFFVASGAASTDRGLASDRGASNDLSASTDRSSETACKGKNARAFLGLV